MEWLIVGVLLGFMAASIVCQWAFRKEIEYKAKSSIDMCLGGKFYTVSRNHKREESNKRITKQ